MKTLKIFPLDYDGRRLEEIGQLILDALPGLMDGFKIQTPISKSSIDDTCFHSPNALLSLQTSRTLEILNTPVLIVTSLALKDSYGHGFCIGTSEGASIVSTYRPEMGKAGSDDHVFKVASVGTHEMAHFFGASHHQKGMPTANGLRCSMDVSQNQGFISRRMHWTEFPVGEDIMLCEKCYEKMGVSHPRYKRNL